MLSTNQLIALIALLLLMFLYLANNTRKSRAAEARHDTERFDDADERFAEIDQNFQLLEHVPTKIGERFRTRRTIPGRLHLRSHLRPQRLKTAIWPRRSPNLERKLDTLIAAPPATPAQDPEQATKLVAVENKIEQLLKLMMASSPPPARRLIMSALSARDSKPLQPPVPQVGLSTCLVSVKTTPQSCSPPMLSHSPIQTQDTPSFSTPAPKLAKSNIVEILTQSPGALVWTPTSTDLATLAESPTYQKLGSGSTSYCDTLPKMSTDATLPLKKNIEASARKIKDEKSQVREVPKYAEDTLTTANDKLEATHKKLKEANQRAEAAEQRKVRAEDDSEKIAGEKLKLAGEAFSIGNELRTTKTKVENLEKENRQVQKYLDQANARLQTSLGEVTKLKSDGKVLRNSLAQKDIEIDDLTKLKSDRKVLQDSLKQKNDQIEDLKMQNTTLEIEKSNAEENMRWSTKEALTAQNQAQEMATGLQIYGAAFQRMVEAGLLVDQYFAAPEEMPVDDAQTNVPGPEQEKTAAEPPASEAPGPDVNDVNVDIPAFTPTSITVTPPVVEQKGSAEVASPGQAGLKGAPNLKGPSWDDLVAVEGVSWDPTFATEQSKAPGVIEILDASPNVKVALKESTGMGASKYASTTPTIAPTSSREQSTISEHGKDEAKFPEKQNRSKELLDKIVDAKVDKTNSTLQKFCNVCKKAVEIESWNSHNRDFHVQCVRKSIHNSLLASPIVRNCRYCDEFVDAPLVTYRTGTTHKDGTISKVDHQIHNFNAHNAHCGISVKNKDEVHLKHEKHCAERATAKGSLNSFDSETGKRIEAPPAEAMSSARPQRRRDQGTPACDNQARPPRHSPNPQRPPQRNPQAARNNGYVRPDTAPRRIGDLPSFTGKV
ncbi:hypothetical protein EK21DRAFT_89599 [Setomelanomma holmii]|uniref:Uncharacterized protein n=1 Tax=Setomelanomma holmii TaxID=210430 RepID=A0A9P4HAN8_9PLEO|nr:hypothetical protein EK21DRAFT_89599 [Setomelanomma holmii]